MTPPEPIAARVVSQHGGHGRRAEGVETAAHGFRIAAVALAERAAALLRPLVARAGAVINGEDADDAGVPVTPQAVVDALMRN